MVCLTGERFWTLFALQRASFDDDDFLRLWMMKLQVPDYRGQGKRLEAISSVYFVFLDTFILCTMMNEHWTCGTKLFRYLLLLHYTEV